VPLKISSALLFEEPSMYSEKKSSVDCARVDEGERGGPGEPVVGAAHVGS
jgi:hypothetical protein